MELTPFQQGDPAGHVEGLVHVSEMSSRSVMDPREVVREGDLVLLGLAASAGAP